MATLNIAELVDANDLEAETIKRFAELTRHGGSADLVVRRNGKDHHFEADWLIRLFRVAAAQGERAGGIRTHEAPLS